MTVDSPAFEQKDLITICYRMVLHNGPQSQSCASAVPKQTATLIGPFAFALREARAVKRLTIKSQERVQRRAMTAECF